MSCHVLVVDRSDIIRAMIRKILTLGEREGLTIHDAKSGKEALDILARASIDLVFTELNLPDMQGDEILNQMAQRNLLPRIPVVILSSSRCRQRMDALKRKGARAYLTKPFRLEHVRAAAVSILGKAFSSKGGASNG